MSLWWHGPSWLKGPDSTWPTENDRTVMEDVNHERGSMVLANVLQERSDLGRLAPECFAHFERLVRVTAFCVRFAHNARRLTPERRCGDLTVEEIQQAECIWFRIVQQRNFGAEIQRIRSGKPLQTDSRLRQFDLLRVGGRNSRSKLCYEARHQVLLPHNDYVVTLLLRQLHERKLHAPPETTLAAVRQKFWILKGRAAVKRVVRDCVICRKVYSAPYQPKMAELPKERITEASPFQRTGVDFAGPLFVRRRRSQAKVYVCLFTCMVTRAIHLELVQGLTTQDFLLAFRRFVARRGRPDYMQSDNFRSFSAADRELDELLSKENRVLMKRELAKDRITWNFITPRAPWSGGYWERLVGSVKTALKKALGHAYVDEQQLCTVLCEIEAQINARPLTLSQR
uniref:Integrase catalytic domain-containing protein n=1 Tax=Trichuris muris TaxID=70415 RepID=A0A5S6Q5G2_TRIMR